MWRLWFALLHSCNGMMAAYRDEAAFREEVWLAIVLVPLGFFLAPDAISLVLMEGSILLIFIVEMLNTAVEATVNRIGPEIHPLAKKAKDAASAAVLFSLVNLVLVWGVILFW